MKVKTGIGVGGASGVGGRTGVTGMVWGILSTDAETSSRLALPFLPVKNTSLAANILAIIFLPGTILHELAHLLTAGIMLVPVGDLEVMPVISEGGVQLGSVQIGQTDPIRRMLIGFAPIFFGVLVILGIIFYSYQYWKLT